MCLSKIHAAVAALQGFTFGNYVLYRDWTGLEDCVEDVGLSFNGHPKVVILHHTAEHKIETLRCDSETLAQLMRAVYAKGHHIVPSRKYFRSARVGLRDKLWQLVDEAQAEDSGLTAELSEWSLLLPELKFIIRSYLMCEALAQDITGLYLRVQPTIAAEVGTINGKGHVNPMIAPIQ